jgi:glutathione peroxidase
MKTYLALLASCWLAMGPSASAHMIEHVMPIPTMGPFARAEPVSAQSTSALDFTFEGIDGKPIDLHQFKGSAVLIVNTASQCGFTEQYSGLEKLWKDYHARGLVVLAVPSNDFGAQEPGSNAEIKQFCTNVYALDFPIAAKTVVKGPEAHPFYQYAARTLGAKNAPRWNFHKYLINADGKLVDWFSSSTEPGDKRLLRAIERALPAKPTALQLPAHAEDVY